MPEINTLEDFLNLKGRLVYEPIHYAFSERDAQEEIVKKVISLVDEQKEDTEYHNTLQRCNDMYTMHNWYKKKEYENQFVFANPLVRIAVDTIVDRELDVTFSTNEGPAKVVPGNTADPIEEKVASLGQRALSWAMDFYGDKETVHEHLFRVGTKYGDSWTKQIWDIEQRAKIVKEEKLTDFGAMLTETEKVETIANGPRMIWIDGKFIHYPLDVPDPVEGPWLVHEYYLTPDEMHRRMFYGEFTKMKVDDENLVSRPASQGDELRKDTITSMTGKDKKPFYKKIYEAHIKWKSIVDEYEHEWIFVVNQTDRTLLRAVRSIFPERPFAKHTPFPIEGKPRGEPMPVILEQLWKYINSIFDLIGDSAAQGPNPGGAVRRGLGMDKKKFTVQPGRFLELANPKEDLVFYNVPEVKQSLFQVLKILLKFFEDLTGTSAPTRGQFPEGVERPTARGIGMVLGQTSIKFEKVNRNFQASLARAYWQMLWMMVNIGGDDYFERLLGESGIAQYYKDQELAQGQTPEQAEETVKGMVGRLKSLKWDVKVEGNTVAADKGLKQRRTLMMSQMIMPLVQNIPKKAAELIAYIVQVFEARGLEHFTDGLVELFEQEQARQEQLALAGQAQKTQGLPAPTPPPLAETVGTTDLGNI